MSKFGFGQLARFQRPKKLLIGHYEARLGELVPWYQYTSRVRKRHSGPGRTALAIHERVTGAATSRGAAHEASWNRVLRNATNSLTTGRFIFIRGTSAFSQ